ncbi:MAG: ABC transporter permease [Acidimicrobiia bacterium]|nr:ABC transporter permease [Acidimicrobiia bacterium]
MTLSARSASFASHLNPVALLRQLWRGWSLIGQFTRREVQGRYRSSLLGLAWSFINPLALLLVYTFVFGIVLKQRWPSVASDGLAQFGLVLFAGLIVFGIFSECATRAAGLIVSTPNYVKKVVFPLELLPVSVLGSALFHAAIGLAVLLVAHLALGGAARASWVLIPVVLLPVVCLSLGLLWMLSSLGVFIRDLGYAVALAVQILFFATPIFYPMEAIPSPYRAVLRSSPLATVVEALRATIFGGPPVAWTSWALAALFGAVVMVVGYAWFMRTCRAFGDVI